MYPYSDIERDAGLITLRSWAVRDFDLTKLATDGAPLTLPATKTVALPEAPLPIASCVKRARATGS
jgi:hypothetical protein